MLGGSSSSGTTTSHTTGNSPIMDTKSSKQIFPCNTCNLTFKDSQTQRTHMREPWHVYNLKRRMAESPSISYEEYIENVATSLVSSKKRSSKPVPSSTASITSPPKEESLEKSDNSDDLADGQAESNSCLFCTERSDDLKTNLEHMSAEHGLYIPEIEHLSSLETIITYLRTVITEYNECLYCGIFKQSAAGIRRHMLDKGHCMINLEREPELLEFWELSDSDRPDTDEDEEDERVSEPPTLESGTAASRDFSQGEYTLPSGKVVGSKSKAREARLFARRTALAAKQSDKQMVTADAVNSTSTNFDTNTDTNTKPPTDPVKSLIGTPFPKEGKQNRTVAVRDAAGLLGVSNQQMRNLVTVHRKMQRQQAIVRASTKWADELGGTHQKHSKQKMWLRDG